MKLVQVCHDSSKTGEGRLAYFSSKCSTIIPLLKEYFPFSQVELFGLTMHHMMAFAKFSAISTSPQK